MVGSPAAAPAPSSPAPHYEAQLPRANPAWPSPQLGYEGETLHRAEDDVESSMKILNRSQVLLVTFDKGTDLIVITAAGLRIGFTGEQSDKADLANYIAAPSGGDFIEVPTGLQILILGEFEKV